MRSLSAYLARIPLNAVPILLVVLLVGIWWISQPAHPPIPAYPAASLREDHDYTVTDSGTASIRWSILETTDTLPVVRAWYMHEVPQLGWHEVDELSKMIIADMTYGTSSDQHTWSTYLLGIKLEPIATGTRITTYLKKRD